MSGPKRGMVAGQPIQTQAQTKEYDDGYERVFGKDRKPVRGRFVYRDGVAVNVDEDWTDAERRAQTVTEEIVYGGVGPHTDGTPINSRTKHRNFMKERGVTLLSDYSDDFRAKEAASKKREDRQKLHEATVNAYKKVNKY